MGLLLTCGTSCSWFNTTIELDQPDNNYFIIQRDTTLTFRWRWANASPSPPLISCPDPQDFRFWWRKRTKGTETYSAWDTLPDSKTDCSDSGTEAVNTTDSLPISCTAGVWYTIEVFFCERGWYEIACDSDCTIGGFNAWKARPIRVLVT